MGVVYKAEDTKLKRIIALKFLPQQIAASVEERERFKIEAQATAQKPFRAALNHLDAVPTSPRFMPSTKSMTVINQQS